MSEWLLVFWACQDKQEQSSEKDGAEVYILGDSTALVWYTKLLLGRWGDVFVKATRVATTRIYCVLNSETMVVSTRRWVSVRILGTTQRSRCWLNHILLKFANKDQILSGVYSSTTLTMCYTYDALIMSNVCRFGSMSHVWYGSCRFHPPTSFS